MLSPLSSGLRRLYFLFFFQFLFIFFLKNTVLLKFDIQIDTSILPQLWAQSHLWYLRCPKRSRSILQYRGIMVPPSFAGFLAIQSLSVPKWNYRLFYPVSCLLKSPGSGGFRDNFYKVINKRTILIPLSGNKKGESYPYLFIKSDNFDTKAGKDKTRLWITRM